MSLLGRCLNLCGRSGNGGVGVGLNAWVRKLVERKGSGGGGGGRRGLAIYMV